MMTEEIKKQLELEAHKFWLRLVKELYPLYHGHVLYADVRDEVFRLEGYFNEIMEVIYREDNEK